MVSDVRIYDRHGELKETITKEQMGQSFVDEYKDMRKDVNLKPTFVRPEKARHRKPVRRLKCVECGARIETRSGLTVLYCHNRCGENYRRKGIKSGAWFKGIKMKEIVWDEPQATRKGIGKYS